MSRSLLRFSWACSSHQAFSEGPFTRSPSTARLLLRFRRGAHRETEEERLSKVKQRLAGALSMTAAAELFSGGLARSPRRRLK